MESIIERYNTYIQDSESYNDFYLHLRTLSNNDKGIMQEIFAKHYFTVYAKLYNVERYCARIVKDSLPDEVNESDLGSDGVIIHTDGKISLVQVKYRKNWESRLDRLCLSGMSLEALALEDNFSKLYLFSNTLFTPTNLSDREKKHIRFVLSDKLMECDWNLIRSCDIFTGESVEVMIPPLRDWQVRARDFVISPDVIENHNQFGRKTVIAACGAGKTLFTQSVTGDRYGSILILVPNLHLLSQWFEKLALWNPDRHFLLVGSDLDDEGTSVPYNLTTDVETILDVYCEHMDNLICISTYVSLPRIIETECAHFEVCVCDEAHVTAGSSGVNNLPTREHFIADNILYITATPRIYKGVAKETCDSMDDESVYGPQFLYSFRQAIDENIISDYNIIIGQGQGNHDNIVFNAKFLKRSIIREELNSVLVFSSTHAQSSQLCAEFSRRFKGDHKIILMPPGANSFKKAQVIHKLNTGAPVIIFNVKVFNLGSDLVPLQAVMLSGNKGSVVDIIQSVSRCMRLHPDKEKAKLLVPCLVETDDFNGPGTFSRLRSFLSAIASVDDSIKEEVILRARNKEVTNRKIYTDMVMTSTETSVDMNIDFDLRMYTSIGNSIGFSPELRFATLKEFCLQEGRLPLQRESYEDIPIGKFLESLLGEKHYAETRDAWIAELLAIPAITEVLEARITDRQDEEKKASRKITPEQRFASLKEFCIQEGRLPLRSDVHADIKIGQFLLDLLSGRKLKNTRDTWIQKLMDIPEITESLESRIADREDEAKKAARKITPEQRFIALKEFCIQEGRLPRQSDVYADIKIGQFLLDLLSGRNYKNTRDTWIQELLEIPEIANLLEARIANNENAAKKASRKITPEQRFVALKEFCIQEERLPLWNDIHADIPIGRFLTALIGGKYYPNTRDTWIQELLEISEIAESLEKRIADIEDEAKKASRKITPEQRFVALKEFCIQEERLPIYSEAHADIPIGKFLKGLLGGKRYTKTRDAWIAELLAIPAITEPLKARLERRGQSVTEEDETEETTDDE